MAMENWWTFLPCGHINIITNNYDLSRYQCITIFLTCMGVCVVLIACMTSTLTAFWLQRVYWTPRLALMCTSHTAFTLLEGHRPWTIPLQSSWIRWLYCSAAADWGSRWCELTGCGMYTWDQLGNDVIVLYYCTGWQNCTPSGCRAWTC